MPLLEPVTDRCTHNPGDASSAPPCLHLLSATSGSCTIEYQGRTLVVDPDCYLLINHAAAAPPRVVADGTLLSVEFSATQLGCATAGAEVPHFLEHLRLIEEPLASHLARAKRNTPSARCKADDDATPLDDVLRSLVAEQTRLQRRAQAIDCVKPSTRRELVRRVLLASDFILSNHAAPIRLDDVALAAHLSRFHLTRLFRQVLGVTPHTLLLNKRLAAARRLLADGRRDMNQVAEMSGFGNRWSLFRRLQRYPADLALPRRPPARGLAGNAPASD